MKRSVIRKFSMLAVMASASLLYGCGNNQVLPIGTPHFAAGCASIAAPIGFSSQNATYTSTNLYAQGMQVGTGGGFIGAVGGVNPAYGLPTLTVQKVASDGSTLALTAQSLNTSAGTFTSGGSATLNGSLTLSAALQQIINAHFGAYTNTTYPTNTSFPTTTPTNAYNTGICVSSASLNAVVNPAGATADARWLSGWVQIMFSNGRSMTMSF